MAKRWFTIMFGGPDPSVDLTKATKSISGDNWIAFDGEADFITTQEAAHKLAQHCEYVWVFVGHVVGKMIATYKDGVYQE